MKKRQEKANEIRDLITQVNARIAELEEDGYTCIFRGNPKEKLGVKYPKKITGIILSFKAERMQSI